ncbi:MAG: Rieske (2Fe-2S) protein, partial [Alphaproteobacteria bacterium]
TRPANDTGEGPDGVVELVTDHKAGHYVSRVIEGPGAAMEIWTKLIPQGDTTDIEVRFLVPAPDDMDLTFIGDAMVSLYTQLWDEDEQMMVERHRALQRARKSEEEIVLGKRANLTLPHTIQSTQGPVHVDEVEGALTAWLGVCPHLLGPLDPTCRKGRTVTCPWHGYQFDCVSGDGIGGDLKIKTRCTIAERDGDLVVRLR